MLWNVHRMIKLLVPFLYFVEEGELIVVFKLSLAVSAVFVQLLTLLSPAGCLWTVCGGYWLFSCLSGQKVLSLLDITQPSMPEAATALIEFINGLRGLDRNTPWGRWLHASFFVTWSCGGGQAKTKSPFLPQRFWVFGSLDLHHLAPWQHHVGPVILCPNHPSNKKRSWPCLNFDFGHSVDMKPGNKNQITCLYEVQVERHAANQRSAHLGVGSRGFGEGWTRQMDAIRKRGDLDLQYKPLDL